MLKSEKNLKCSASFKLSMYIPIFYFTERGGKGGREATEFPASFWDLTNEEGKAYDTLTLPPSILSEC